MNDIKPPVDNLADIWPWVSTIVLSMWGGIVQYAQRVRAGESFSWQALSLDLIVCSFAGLLTFLLCESADIHGALQAVMIAISAHMGTRAIASLEVVRDRILGGVTKP